jgi:transposase
MEGIDLNLRMSDAELAKLALIQGAVEGLYSVEETARKLRLSRRQVQRLKKAFRERGAEALVHGNRGRRPANCRSGELRARIIALKKSELYEDSSFARFRSLLAEQEGIHVSYGTLSSLLKAAGIQPARRHRREGRYRRRKRKKSFGELLQAGAGSFDWFGAGEIETLHGIIDDATGQITALYFCENECLTGYLAVLRQTLRVYGVPLELYVDRTKICAGFQSAENAAHISSAVNRTGGEQAAGKTLDETPLGAIAGRRLGITLTAYSPQAKGRIERLWNTLRDRLSVWLRLNGITDREEANQMLPHFAEEYNARFAVPAESPDSAFVPLTSDDDLDKLLAVRCRQTTGCRGC